MTLRTRQIPLKMAPGATSDISNETHTTPIKRQRQSSASHYAGPLNYGNSLTQATGTFGGNSLVHNPRL